MRLGRSPLPAALTLALLSGCCNAVKKLGGVLGPWWFMREEHGHVDGAHGLQTASNWLSRWTEDSEDESRTKWLSVPEIEATEDKIAIVTHAGKNDQEFIDMAVMLGVSLQRHVPNYPRIALAIEGMTEENKAVLQKAGWRVLMVEDWQPSANSAARNCGGSCIDDGFTNRWADAFEKLNMFRIQANRVLFLDADLHVVSDKLGFLLNSTDLPEGNIGMAPDGCKEEHNSGVMLFRPNLDIFRSLVEEVSGVMDGKLDKKADQPIVNQIFKGKITPLDKNYNCLNPTGRTAAAECFQGCKDPVVAHFTGVPKPARADLDFLDIVRRPASPLINCMGTNHGSCEAWSEFYCDLHGSINLLTTKLQKKLSHVGQCCTKPWKEGDPAECATECPNQLKLDSSDLPQSILGLYNQTNIESSALYNGGRPIYVGPDHKYLFYVKHKTNWIVGPSFHSDAGLTYAHSRGLCPTEPMSWKHWAGDKATWVVGSTLVSQVTAEEASSDMIFDPILRGNWISKKDAGVYEVSKR